MHSVWQILTQQNRSLGGPRGSAFFGTALTSGFVPSALSSCDPSKFYDVCINDACIFDVGYPELDKGKDGEEVYKVRKLNLRWP